MRKQTVKFILVFEKLNPQKKLHKNKKDEPI